MVLSRISRVLCLVGVIGVQAADTNQTHYTSHGANTACREKDPEDADDKKSGMKYDHITVVSSLDTCKAVCDARASCKGIEYNKGFESGRCEIWFTEVNHSVSANGFECLKYVGSRTEDSDMWVSFNLTMGNIKDLTNLTEEEGQAVTGVMSSMISLVAGVLKNLTVTGFDSAKVNKLSSSDVRMRVTSASRMQVIVDPSETVNPLVVYEVLRGDFNSLPDGKKAVLDALKAMEFPAQLRTSNTTDVSYTLTGRAFHFENLWVEKDGSEKTEASSSGRTVARWALMVLTFGALSL